MFMLAFVVAGLVIGWARGGSPRSLLDLHLRAAWLILLGLLLQVIAFTNLLPDAEPYTSAIPIIYFVSNTAVLIGLGLNLRLWPVRLAAVGVFFNFIAILANGGYMPASAEAVRAAGLTRQLAILTERGYLANSTLMDESTRLILLCDIFYLPSWMPLANVFSVGDVLLGLGAMWLVAAGMGRRNRHS